MQQDSFAMPNDTPKTRSTRRSFSLDLGARLREIAHELHGEEGTEVVAALLGIPIRTLKYYEEGVTLPAEHLLGFIAATGVNPAWLSIGKGPKFAGFRNSSHGPAGFCN
jgi:hypothetical protein